MLGNGNPKYGDKGSNFKYELSVLQLLELISTAIPAAACCPTAATEATLVQVLSALQNGKEFEQNLVIDLGGVGCPSACPTYLQVRIYNTETHTFDPPVYFNASGASVVPVGPLELVNPQLVLNNILTQVSSINTKTPVLGQDVMANSEPVVIASDQTPIPINIQGKQTDFYPNALPVDETVTIEASFDVKGNLKTRSGVLTDEGTFRVNFANSSLRVSIGNCTFVNGSRIVTGANFDTYDVKVGDYVNADGHADSTLAQIESISLTEIILSTTYTGASVSGPASRQIVRSVVGTGSSITVASGAVTIAAQTTANAVTLLGRLVDVAPLIFRAGLSVSQRIINQDINIGLTDESPVIKWYARFQINGATNTTIKCQTARNPTIAPSGNEIQETIVTIPNGLTTASSLEYRVELLTEEVIFYINEIRVARHTRVIPSQYDLMGAGIAVINGATPPASNTNIVIDYITCKNHNKLEIGVMSSNESIQSSQVPLSPFNFSQAGVIAINTDVLIIDCLQLRTVNLQVTSIGTTGRLGFFLTNDLTVVGTAQPAYPIGGAVPVVNTTSAGHWNIPTNGARYLRIRLGVATTAGTTTLFASGSPFAMPLPLPTTQPISGSVTATVTSTTISGGQAAHSAAVTGNPVRVGAKVAATTAATTDTTLIAGDTADAFVSTSGQAIIKPFGTAELDFTFNMSTASTVTSLQQLVPASGTASVRNYLTGLMLQTDTLGAAGNAWVLDGQGAIGTSVTIATPGVFTSTAHDLKVGDAIVFTSLGTITGVSVNTVYYITATSFAATTFTIATTLGGSAIQITGVTSAFTFYRVLYALRLQTTAIGTPAVIKFPTPLRGISNGAINLLIPSSLTSGNIYLTPNGYRGF